MPKVTFICPNNLSVPERELLGIDRKVLAQIEAFRHAGFACEALHPRQEGKLGMALERLPLCPDSFRWDLLEVPQTDAVYIRRPVYASMRFMGFLARLRATNPQAPILYEIPTYPYDAELKTPRMYPILLKDRAHRQKLFDYVDAFVLLGGEHEVFGHPAKTIRIKNGIDLETTYPHTPAMDKESFDIVCSAIFSPWHGIDRFIEGMAQARELVNERHVILHLAGDGPALPDAKHLVAQHGLENNVVFHGMMNREGLDALLDECDFAVASLGLHRIDPMLVASTLKTREYLAKGMPFVYSGHIDVFDEDPVDFCFEAPSNESPIDLAGLLEFADTLYASGQKPIITRIRTYAEAHVGWPATMAPVFDYLHEWCSS